MIMSLLLCLFFSTLFAPEATRLTVVEHQPLNPYSEVYMAVKMVESGDRDVINYTEGAYGRAQIRQCKLDEYNEATGSSFVLRDCLDESVSREIFMWHMMQYNDIEIAVKRWNGSGPMTEIYLDKVKRYL
jgi:hypothetical protein